MSLTVAPRPSTRRSIAASVVGVAAAACVAAGGVLHLRVWNQTYRAIPDGTLAGLWVVKKGFPVNAALSVLLATALVLVSFGLAPARRGLVIGLALLLEVGSAAALVLSRSRNLFSWTEQGYHGDPGRVLAVEALAIALLIVTSWLPPTVRR